MIEIVIFTFETLISFEDECINVLEIENQSLFTAMVESFYQLSTGEEPKEQINIFKDGNPISFGKIGTVIIDPFTLNLEDKKIIAKLHQHISENLCCDIEKNEKFSKISQELTHLILDLAYELDFEYDYNVAPSPIDITKMLGLKIAFKKDSNLRERFLDYINIVSTFKLYDLLVMVNLKTYFSQEDLLEIYKYAKYKKVELLLIESQNSKLLTYEKKLIIDKEYDEFVEKNNTV